jgi:hypothetical protein
MNPSLAGTPRPPRWTPAQIAWAASHIGKPGWSFDLVGAKLGRTGTAVKLRLKRSKVRKPVTGRIEKTLSMRQVCRVMGLDGHHGPVRRWLNAGLLKGSRAPIPGRLCRWVVYPVDLCEFLQRHPEAYEGWRIPAELDGKPNPYHRFAQPNRVLSGVLSMKAAAKDLGIAIGTLRRWHREGRLSSVKRSGPGIQEQEHFFTREQLAEAKSRMRRLKNGWWTMDFPERSLG